MNILQLCPKSPFPPTEGGPMAMKAIRDGLVLRGHRVFTLTMSTPSYPVKDEWRRNIPGFQACDVDTRVKPFNAFTNLLMNRSYHVARFKNRRFASVLQQVLSENTFDAVLCESIYMMPYFEQIVSQKKIPVLLRAHNVEHLIWQRVAAGEKNFIKQWYLKILAAQLKKYEIRALSEAHAIAAISSVDALFFSKLCPEAHIHTIPFALDVSFSEIDRRAFTGRFGHIGSMDWAPNLEGINWFLTEVWPSIHHQFPNVSFHLAGRNMPASIQTNEQMQCFVHGEVADSKVFISSLDVLVVPLFSGSGVRIKIAEAMSLGVPVLTTAVGAEGLEVTGGNDVFIATDKLEMIEIVREITQNPLRLGSVTENALNTIKEHHSPEKVSLKLESILEELCQQ